MSEMMELLMDVRKEVRCAEKYAREASKHRHEYPELAQVYHRVAADKLEHAAMLNTQAGLMAEKNGMLPVWEVEDAMFDLDKQAVKDCLEQRHK